MSCERRGFPFRSTTPTTTTTGEYNRSLLHGSHSGHHSLSLRPLLLLLPPPPLLPGESIAERSVNLLRLRLLPLSVCADPLPCLNILCIYICSVRRRFNGRREPCLLR